MDKDIVIESKLGTGKMACDVNLVTGRITLNNIDISERQMVMREIIKVPDGTNLIKMDKEPFQKGVIEW